VSIQQAGLRRETKLVWLKQAGLTAKNCSVGDTGSSMPPCARDAPKHSQVP